MEFILGLVVGFITAGLIGRAKFLTVQNQLRQMKDNFIITLRDYEQERDLNDGLTQELDAVSARSRLTTV